MKNKIFTSILLTGLSLGTVYSQNLNKPKLDSLLNILTEKNKAMGSLTISKNGAVLYSRAIGYSFISDNEKISATEKTRVFKVVELALEVYANKGQKISTSKLNDAMLKAVESYHAPVVRGHSVKIKFVTQLPTPVPSFAFFTNYPDDIKMPYRNYLENQLRTNFNFKGVPLRIFFRKK